MPEQSSATTNDTTVVDRSNHICDSILDAIGDTPLVRLNRIAQNVDCEILVKCEFCNPGGSVKDRISKQMMLDAERNGVLNPPTNDDATTTTLIEATSGNTGIGLAMCAAIRGYRCIVTMPEKMSKEKVDVLKALGAEIVRTPTEAAHDAPDSHVSVARKLEQEIPGAHILDQYANPSNPMAHYEGTAAEIWKQTNGKVDMVVVGAGTGGTISGIAKRLKECNPDIIVVGVDPKGSILAQPDQLNDEDRLEPYHVEGIGYDFIPKVLDRKLVDRWVKTNDTESLVMMRRLIREEGLLCGGSSGAAVAAALKLAPRLLHKGQRCVVILPDSVRNYMTKALSDDWMVDHGFVDGKIIKAKHYSAWWAQKRVCDLPCLQHQAPLTITSDVSCKEAISLLKEEGFDMVPVLDDEGCVLGVVTEGNMTNRLLSGRASADTTVLEAGVIYKTFHKFTQQCSLGDLAQALDHDPYALIVTEQRCFSGSNKRRRKISEDAGDTFSSTAAPSCQDALTKKTVVSGIVTRIDLLDFVSSGQQEQNGVEEDRTK